jgi:amidase
MLAALDNKTISSVELVELHERRIEERDGDLNAIPVRTFDRAREAATRADQARARGERAPLLGLPMTLKESTQTAGLPQSAGIEPLKDYRPANDGPIASSVFAAGACLLGKTNIPVALGDWQADSPVYGRTNNPWDLERTPGGSTGGGGAALAAGMTPLEIGSDIGGSIRVPAAYCGLYGHRPSQTAVPRAGAFPFGDAENPAIVMGVQGPLARSAVDIELLFDVVAGPGVGERAGWRLDLPPARGKQLSDLRVAIMPRLEMVQPSAEMHAKVDELAVLLDKAGATVGEAMPDVDRSAYLKDYLTLLAVITSLGQSRSDREKMASETTGNNEDLMAAMAKGFTIDAMDYVMLLGRREAARAAWRAFFEDWDVLVCPAALDAAFKHQSGPQPERMLPLDGTAVPYMLNIVYPMWAIFTGQPATAFPAGLNSAGLPLGCRQSGRISKTGRRSASRSASSASGTASNLRPATDGRVRGGGASLPRRPQVSRRGTSRTTDRGGTRRRRS